MGSKILMIFLAFSWVIGMMEDAIYTTKTVNLTEQPGNGGQAYIYIVRNGGKTKAGSGGKREKKHTDHVFPSSACEPLDQRCVSFERL